MYHNINAKIDDLPIPDRPSKINDPCVAKSDLVEKLYGFDGIRESAQT